MMLYRSMISRQSMSVTISIFGSQTSQYGIIIKIHSIILWCDEDLTCFLLLSGSEGLLIAGHVAHFDL